MSVMDLFIGPCVMESEAFVDEVASQIVEVCAEFRSEIRPVFKSSFDKANRSSVSSFRGIGMEKGLQIFESVKKKYQIEVLTDFHLPDQAEQLGSVVDVLQVPAFLCRQTDMILAGAEAKKKYGGQLKIKKGQFLSPEETKNIVVKASEFLSKDQILLTERGTTFGYQNLVVDMRSFSIMKSFGVKVIHDVTHSLQRPGGLGTATAGDREFARPLGRAAIAAGADGLFMEVHPNPEKALSDATTQLPLTELKSILEEFLAIKRVMNGLSNS